MQLDLLPVDDISLSCASEKSIRHGHISTLQFWWARRPLAICRSTIFLALCPTLEVLEANPAVLKKLRELLGFDNRKSTSELLSMFSARLARWESTKDKSILELARSIIRLKYPDGPVILDPFAGGGSIPLEALRLGAKVYAGDLNPVAFCSLDLALRLLPKQGPKIFYLYKTIAKEVSDELDKQLSNLYQEGENALAFIWAKSYRCPTCNCVTPLVRSRVLARGKRDIIYTFKYKADDFPEIHINYTPSEEEIKAARNATVDAKGAKCQKCGHKVGTDYLQKEGCSGRLGEIPISCYCVKEGKKEYVAIKSVHSQFNAALDKNESSMAKAEDIAFDKNAVRHIWAMQYGITTVRDLFNARQYISLRIIQKIIIERLCDLKDADSDTQKTIAVLLSLTLNRIVMYSNRHSWWQANGEFPANIFIRQAISMVWDYVEIPPTSRYASGWRSASDWILRAIDGFKDIKNQAEVWCGDASHIPVNNGSVDLLFTDPPYFDSITYAYLSDLFYALMKPILSTLYKEEFSSESTPKKNEAIVDRKHKDAPEAKTAEHFRAKMEEFFKDARRVIKPDGALVLMYGHKSALAWASILEPLVNNTFSICTTIPIHTERKVKFKHSKIDALGTSCLIYSTISTQNSSVKDNVSWEDFCALLSNGYENKKVEYLSLGNYGNDAYSAFIAEAVQQFGQYRVCLNNGKNANMVDLFRLLQTME